jgi:hypothetical protein
VVWYVVAATVVSAVVFLTGLQRKERGSVATDYVLSQVAHAVEEYEAYVSRSVPVFEARDELEDWLLRYGWLRPGERLVDGWGRPLVYGRDARKRYGFYIYSAGRNGIDEHGGGDDYVLSGFRPWQGGSGM